MFMSALQGFNCTFYNISFRHIISPTVGFTKKCQKLPSKKIRLNNNTLNTDFYLYLHGQRNFFIKEDKENTLDRINIHVGIEYLYKVPKLPKRDLSLNRIMKSGQNKRKPYKKPLVNPNQR